MWKLKLCTEIKAERAGLLTALVGAFTQTRSLALQVSYLNLRGICFQSGSYLALRGRCM